MASAELSALTGRAIMMVEPYAPKDADRAVVGLGSTAGTIKDVVDELSAEDERVGLLRICSFRPAAPRGDTRGARRDRVGRGARPLDLAGRHPDADWAALVARCD